MSDTHRKKEPKDEKKGDIVAAMPLLIDIRGTKPSGFGDSLDSLQTYLRFAHNFPGLNSFTQNGELVKRSASDEFRIDLINLHTAIRDTRWIYSNSEFYDNGARFFLVKDKVIGINKLKCATFVLDEKKSGYNLRTPKDSFTIFAVPSSIETAKTRVFPDQEHLAFVYKTNPESAAINIVDLNARASFVVAHPTSQCDIDALAVDENNNMIVFYRPTKESKPEDRCVRYQLDFKKREATPEKIALGFDCKEILRVECLSGNRFLIIRARNLADDVCVCRLEEGSLKLSGIVGKINRDSPIEVFDQGQVFVYQDYETNELRIVVAETLQVMSHEMHRGALSCIIPTSSNVGCLVFRIDNSKVNDVRFLTIPNFVVNPAATLTATTTAARAEITRVLARDPAGIVMAYTGDYHWVDDGSPSMQLPFLGSKDPAFGVCDVIIFGKLSMPMPYVMSGMLQLPRVRETRYLEAERISARINGIKSVAELDEILTEQLMVVKEYLRIVKKSPPDPRVIKCKRDFEDLIQRLRDLSGSFFKCLDKLHTEYDFSPFQTCLADLLSKARSLPEIIAREEREDKFESATKAMKKFDSKSLSHNPATDRSSLNNQIQGLYQQIESKLEAKDQPRILLEAISHWLKACEALQQLSDQSAHRGFLSLFTATPQSPQLIQLTMVRTDAETLRTKGDAVTFDQVKELLSKTANLKDYPGDINEQIVVLGNRLSGKPPALKG